MHSQKIVTDLSRLVNRSFAKWPQDFCSNFTGEFFMNVIVKSAIAGALALGGTGVSLASNIVPNMNNSDLVLIVQNTTTQATYALDTGITINSILPTANLVSGAVLNSTAMTGLSQTISASATLQSFLATNPIAGDQWTIEAAQYNGNGAGSTKGNSIAPGAAKVVYSSAYGTAIPFNASAFSLATMQQFLNGYNNDAAVNSGGLLPLSQSATATESTAVTYSANAGTKYTMFGTSDLQPADGSAITLFGFTGNGTTGQIQSYLLGTVSLAANGTLTIAGNGTTPPPVPLPPAVWLFGSGILGLVGVSRRRKVTEAVA